MTTKLEPTVDALAAYLITDLTLLARSNPTDFYNTLDAHDDPSHLAELLIIDEYDVPDDLYYLFDIDDNETERLDALIALRENQRLFDLVLTALTRLIADIPRP